MFERFKNFGRSGQEKMPQTDNDKFLGDFETREAAEAGLKSLNEGIEKLKADIEESNRQSAADRTRIDDLLVAQMGRPASSAADPVEEKLPDLPNPAEDPEGYARTIQERADIRENQKARAQGSEAKKNGALNTIWSDFQRENAELFDNENDQITKGFVTEELTRIKALGIDDARDYVIQNPDLVKRNIATKARDYLDGRGLLGKDDKKNAGKDGNQSSPDQQADRTAGIPGGAGLPPQGVDTQDGSNATKGNFVEEVQDFQRANGFF